MPHSPERLAYWYFRLNGFLTTENFIVHPDEGKDQRTDADLLAVRFQHRAENVISPMQDDPRVSACNCFINIIIAEVKSGRCALNGPWTDPAKENIERVLRAIGCLSEESIQQAAVCLYEKGAWQCDSVCIRLFAVGEEKSRLVVPDTQQLTWSDVIEFVCKRFQTFRRQKSSVGQWTEDGRELQRLAARRNANMAIRKLFGLSTRVRTES